MFTRSCRAMNTLLVSINKQIYQFQTYAEITGVSPASGSTEGGTNLAITGRYFTGMKENTKVYVGGKLIVFCCQMKGVFINTFEKRNICLHTATTAYLFL